MFTTVNRDAASDTAEPDSVGHVGSESALASRRQLLPGIGALGAGIAWVVWAAINTRTHGGLDAGAAAVGERLARVGALLMVAWNVLLLPAAVALDAEMRTSAAEVTRLVTLAGIASLLFWAYGGATHTITPTLEVSYLALSAFWWGGLGVHLRRTRPMFGMFTLILAAFALWDATLTAFEPISFSLYLTAAPKLPLAIVWDFWVAWTFLSPPASGRSVDLTPDASRV
jgi:hypothetical protein